VAVAEEVYEEIFNEEDGRICKGIPEEACSDVPRNFFLHLFSRIATKLGDTLSKPGLVLTWLLLSLGAPEFLLASLVPVRQAGALFPQLIVGGYIRGFAIRKGFWVVGSLGQGGAVGGMAVVAVTLSGAAAGWAIVALLVVFSLCRGICSVATKDLVGKTVPKQRRGRLGGLAGSIAGVFGGLVGLLLLFYQGTALPVAVLAIFLAAAGLLWAVAALLMGMLHEHPGATDGGANALREAARSLRYFATDPVFLRFCIARGLLAGTVLSMPFYVVLAKSEAGDGGEVFGGLLIVGSLAQFLSGFAWGRLADYSSRKTLILAGTLGGGIGLGAFLLATMQPQGIVALLSFGALYFLITLAHTGIRLGRKTFLVDFAPADRRPAYVALSNTGIGIVLLASSGLGAIANLWGAAYLILVFALLGLAGVGFAVSLPEVEEAA
jgi:hypothetical protein